MSKAPSEMVKKVSTESSDSLNKDNEDIEF